jgi:hypothetical protein
MLKAQPSYPTSIYADKGHVVEHSRRDKVADVMSRYYTRLDEIFHTGVTEQSKPARSQPTDFSYQCGATSGAITGAGRSNTMAIPFNTAKLDFLEYMNSIKQSRRKVEQISTIFSKFDDNMKQLENEGQLLNAVRENLGNLGLNFWDWLKDGKYQAIIKPVPSS